MSKIKFTTIALDTNEHLLKKVTSSYFEVYCIGYRNGKREKTLDGYYFREEVFRK